MRFIIFLIALVASIPVILTAQQPTVLTNHIGYDGDKAKKAVIVAQPGSSIVSFRVLNIANGNAIYEGKPLFAGPVKKWKNWVFWTVDFSSVKQEGNYKIEVSGDGKNFSSYPFMIGKNILEQATLSDLIYYFKGQRSSGLLDQADHRLHLAGKQGDSIDAHGGWYDATGDYGKHLSHLSFSSYFNPQQVSLTVWGLLKTFELLNNKPGTDFRQYKRRVLDEAMYGADYLVRVQAKDGSFYRSVSAPGPGKFAKDREIRAEDKGYRIKQSKDQPFSNTNADANWKSYQSSYRSGGGMAIAALAIASSYDTSGDFSNATYLRAAENAFAFLEANNLSMTNDGKENIVDNYCALNAAAELYRATKNEKYKTAAEKRAKELIARLSSWNGETDFWRADDKDRPFFHPSDAGLPAVSLAYYYQLASPETQVLIKHALARSFHHEFKITHEVINPFGYSRQLVQDTLGNRRSAFFFPHGSEASPWWQGENARLGSMAAAARITAKLFQDNKPFCDSLKTFAVDQLNWILGLNPYDACMLQGSGHNNPAYQFFGTFEYTNAPGGIVNGITSGFDDEDGIDFNLAYKLTGKDNDWRWVEQWLPHATWYLMAVSLND